MKQTSSRPRIRSCRIQIAIMRLGLTFPVSWRLSLHRQRHLHSLKYHRRPRKKYYWRRNNWILCPHHLKSSQLSQRPGKKMASIWARAKAAPGSSSWMKINIYIQATYWRILVKFPERSNKSSWKITRTLKHSFTSLFWRKCSVIQTLTSSESFRKSWYRIRSMTSDSWSLCSTENISNGTKPKNSSKKMA